MRLGRALKEKLMDVRVRDKLVAEGKLTKEEVQKFIDSLPDDSENVSYTDSAESRESVDSNTH
jgi:polyhydroxyalkanoate synthesis regulator phasin